MPSKTLFGSFGFLTVAVLFCLGALPFFIHPVLNNRTLSRLEQDFAKLEHPAETSFIKRRSEVGLLVGNGDHCDYFVGEIRSYTGDDEKIRAFYRGKTLPSPHGNHAYELDEVIFLRNGEIPKSDSYHFPSQYQTIKGWSISAENFGKKLYILRFLETGDMNEGCDIRCY